MVVLKKADQATHVGRLRFDRDSHIRSTVAEALPVLLGEEAIPLLEEMIQSTSEARWELIKLGDRRDSWFRSDEASVGQIRQFDAFHRLFESES